MKGRLEKPEHLTAFRTMEVVVREGRGGQQEGSRQEPLG